MELAVLDNKMPVKAIPEQKLNQIILTVFIDWLSGLLSLTGETSSERLEIALPAIKQHCWSMGFDEIKLMFEMYADNKLSIEPIPNYFDRILFGKIVNAYKQQKPRVKKELKMPEQTQEEKDLLIYEGLIFCYDNWEQTKNIIDGQIWVHDHLMELNLLDFTDKEKETMWIKAKSNLEAYSKTLDRESAKDLIRELARGKSSAREVEYKKIRVKRFFANIYVKGKHIKDFI